MSKTITVPVPGFIARTNSHPATIVLSPDQRYAALPNQGYGAEQSRVRQSIAILDLRDSQLHDFPDDRLRGDEPSTFRFKGVRLKPLILELGFWFAWAEVHSKIDVFHGGSNPL